MLGQNNYGKSGIRLLKVARREGRHEIREMMVAVRFEGDFEPAHAAGDNSLILPTDTMKNTVYALAKEDPIASIESFGLHLSGHFLRNNPPVSRVVIHLSERPWERISVEGRPHPHAFLRPGGETHTASITRAREGVDVESGVEELMVLKSAQSGFAGYLKDPYTTLKETRDRIFATAVKGVWRYHKEQPNFDQTCRAIRQTLLETFAEHESASVQHTLYAMGEAVLERHSEVSEIRLSLPNKHHLLVDLTPFGLANENEVFVATDEPFGLIEAAIRRGSD